MKENDGPDGGERRATAMTPAFREQRDVYRAHCIKTKSDDGNPKESDPDPDVLNSAAVEWQSNNGAALNPPAMPLQSSSKYNLRDACSRLYQQHHGAGKKTIHSSMQVKWNLLNCNFLRDPSLQHDKNNAFGPEAECFVCCQGGKLQLPLPPKSKVGLAHW